MKAGEIRRRVLEDHDELRDMLERIRPLAERFEAGDDEAGAELRERALALYARFETHLEFEDRWLAPALRAGGPASSRHAEHLEREHREQRELLSYLLGRLQRHPHPTLLVARELRNFSEYLRLDMRYEEETLLGDVALGGGPQPGGDG